MDDYVFFFNFTKDPPELPVYDSAVLDDNYRTTEKLMKIYPPLFIFLGTIGNMLSCVIWYKQLGESVTQVFVMAFTITNLIGLYLEPLIRSTYHWYQYDMRQTKDLCKTVYILDSVVAFCSVWFLFGFCLERTARLLQINGSEKARRRAIVFVLLVILASFILRCYDAITVKTDKIQERNISVFQTTSSLVCGVQTNIIFMSSRDFNFFWVQQLTYCLLPSTLILGCIIAIGQILHAYQRGNVNPFLKRGIPITKGDTELARTAMFLGIMQIICTVPITLYRTQVDVIATSSEELMYTVLAMLVHADYTFKFFLYCALNESFRKSLVGLFKTGVLLRQMSAQKLRQLSIRRRKQLIIDVNMEMTAIHCDRDAYCIDQNIETSSEQLSSGRSIGSEKTFQFGPTTKTNGEFLTLNDEEQSSCEV